MNSQRIQSTIDRTANAPRKGIVMQVDFQDAIKALKDNSFSSQSLNKLFKSSPNYSELLKTSDTISKSVRLEKKERNFKSQEINFINSISFYTDNPPNAKHAISISYLNIRGEKITLKPLTTDSYIFVFIRDFTNNFEICYSGSGTRPKVQKIQISGLDGKVLDNTKPAIAEFLSSSVGIDTTIKKLKSDFDAAESLIEAANEEISAQDQQKLKREKEIRELLNKIEELSAISEKHQSNISEAENRLFSISNDEAAKQNSYAQLQSQELSINNRITNLKSTLEGLQRDKEIISDEFIDYVKEGKGQVRNYLGAIVIAFFIIGLCVALLFNGASNLLNTTYNSTSDVFAAFILRLPFAAVLSGVILGAGAFVKYLIGRTVHINEERLILAKLLVIAKDVVNSATDKLTLSDQERLDARIRLKIDLLKAHLTNELGHSLALNSSEPKHEVDPVESPENVAERKEPQL